MTQMLKNAAGGEVWQEQHELVPVPNERIRREVLHYAAICLPDQVHWCGGKQEERQILKSQAGSEGEQAVAHPIITPVGRWTPPIGAQSDRLPGADVGNSVRHLFHESMKGRVMYVVPFVIAAEGGTPEIIGIQLTDSAAVCNEIETAFPSGDQAWAHLASGGPYWLCLHAAGNLETPDDRVRWELPRERTLWAYGPGYGVQTLRRVILES